MTLFQGFEITVHQHDEGQVKQQKENQINQEHAL